MTDLQARATAYAAMMMKDCRGETFSREDLLYAYRDAYEQGYVDCGTEGEEPETQDEYFNDAPDCEYFYGDGNCSKGLPDTPCEREGCGAYCPKKLNN